MDKMPLETGKSLAYELGRVQGCAEHMEMALQAAHRYLKHRQAVEDTWAVQNTLSSIERGLEAYRHIKGDQA